MILVSSKKRTSSHPTEEEAHHLRFGQKAKSARNPEDANYGTKVTASNPVGAIIAGRLLEKFTRIQDVVGVERAL